MEYIKELFDPTHDIRKRIDSVVTFADNSEDKLRNEINEYIVTETLHNQYNKVLEELQDAFTNSSTEVGVWVSGFYGSGKSSFAKYLGYSFQKSLMVDGVSFGERLMNRMNDRVLKALHRTVIQRFNPMVVLIDLTTQGTTGTTSNVSDIIYAETLKLLGINNTDPKVMSFLSLLHQYDKYDEFVQLVRENEHQEWEEAETNTLVANKYAAQYAPILFPNIFKNEDEYNNINVESIENETERFKRLIELIKIKTGHEHVIFVIDEVGQYVAASDELITSLQGTMQILKSQFKGKVWLIGTAQQTLTEDNPQAQLNSGKLFKLNDRFPIKVDIESDDIKEILTKRLLGKSSDSKDYLKEQFRINEHALKLATKLTSDNSHSQYIKILTEDLFADLYPFLPVHIDILMSLLQRLASRTGGAGLRPIIRLVRDILVEQAIMDEKIGLIVTPDIFYDALRHEMKQNANFQEIVAASKKAIELYGSRPLAVKACKTIAVMQILDDFSLTFDNLAALMYSKIGVPVDKPALRTEIDMIKDNSSLTLQEIDGKLRFMTNAILTVQDERSRILPTESDKRSIVVEILKDILIPTPSVQIFGAKVVQPMIELTRLRQTTVINQGSVLKVNLRFVDNADYETVHNKLKSESTNSEHQHTIFWIATLSRDIEVELSEIVKSEKIRSAHINDTNQEIKDYVRAQGEEAERRKGHVKQILREALTNSETIAKGSPTRLDGTTSQILGVFSNNSLKPFAEQAYNKYALAPKNMPSSVVKDLFNHDEIPTLPASLNPFGIVRSDGTVDTSHGTFAEIKDFISQYGDVTGTQVLEKFSGIPYGWTKDTVRYLIALMLKASIVVMRKGGQSYKMFTKKASEEMGNNNLFGSVGLSLNTEGTLTPTELMKAKNELQSLYNPQGLAPLVAKIAKCAYKVAAEKKGEVEQLYTIFQNYNIGGIEKVAKAVATLKKIVDSEGAEAPYIFAKEEECVEALKFVKEVLHKESQARLLSNIRQIHCNITSSVWVEQFPILSSLNDGIRNAREAFNNLLGKADLPNHTTEYADLLSTLQSYVEQGCTHFYAEATGKIHRRLDEIHQNPDYQGLTDSQKQMLETKMSTVSINEPTTLDTLRDTNDRYNRFFIPDGIMADIANSIASFKKSNEEAAGASTGGEDSTSGGSSSNGNGSQPTNGDGSNPATGGNSSTAQFTGVPSTSSEGDGATLPTANDSGQSSYPSSISIPRRLTTRAQVEDLMRKLQELLTKVGDNSPIDINLQ